MPITLSRLIEKVNKLFLSFRLFVASDIKLTKKMKVKKRNSEDNFQVWLYFRRQNVCSNYLHDLLTFQTNCRS